MTHRLNHMYIQEDKYRMEKEMAERSGSHSREKQNYIDTEAPLGMCVCSCNGQKSKSLPGGGSP